MEKLKQIPKWVYILIAFIGLMLFSIVTYNSSEKNFEESQSRTEEKESTKTEEESKKEYTLDDFPEVKNEMEKIISKLKENEWFTMINFQYLVGEEDYIKDKSNWIGVKYKLNYNEYEITPGITFTFKNDKIHHIQYSVVGSSETSTQKYNRKIELLKAFGITENSFSNSDANNRWETLKHIVSGENCDTYALTDDGNQVSCYQELFSIYIDWLNA